MSKLTQVLSKIISRDDGYKKLEKEARMQKILEQRQKSHEERLLERHNEEQRQVRIKEAVKKIQEKEKKEIFKSNMWKKNNADGKKEDVDGRILNQKKLFPVKPMEVGGNMFFR